MCPFNANQTRGCKRPASSCLPPLSGRSGSYEKWLWGGGQGDSLGVISGFEGIEPHFLLLAWPQMTPGRPRHNKEAKGAKVERGEIKTDPGTCMAAVAAAAAAAAAANLGFPSRTSCLSILCGQIMSFSAFSLRQQTISCSFCDKKKFDVVGVQDLWSPAWLKYFAFQSILPSGCGVQIKSLQRLLKPYTI